MILILPEVFTVPSIDLKQLATEINVYTDSSWSASIGGMGLDLLFSGFKPSLNILYQPWFSHETTIFFVFSAKEILSLSTWDRGNIWPQRAYTPQGDRYFSLFPGKKYPSPWKSLWRDKVSDESVLSTSRMLGLKKTENYWYC